MRNETALSLFTIIEKQTQIQDGQLDSQTGGNLDRLTDKKEDKETESLLVIRLRRKIEQFKEWLKDKE